MPEGTFTFKEAEKIADLAFRKGWVQAHKELGYPLMGAVPLPEEAPRVTPGSVDPTHSNYRHIIDAALKSQKHP